MKTARVLVVAGMFACGEERAPVADVASADGGVARADGGASAPHDAGARPPIDEICTTIEAEAPIVERTRASGAVAPAVGGTIAPGKYFLTAINAYTTEPVFLVTRFAVTLVVTDQHFDFATTSEAEATVYRSRSTYTTKDSSLTMTTVCSRPLPDGGASSSGESAGLIPFTATENELRLYPKDNWGTDEVVYTKQ